MPKLVDKGDRKEVEWGLTREEIKEKFGKTDEELDKTEAELIRRAKDAEENPQYLAENFFPTVLPFNWRIRNVGGNAITIYRVPSIQGARVLAIIGTVAREQDGKWWVHLSCSYPDRLPTWDDLKEIRDVLLGPDKQVIQIIPPKQKHVNIHNYALHLFHCIDGDPLPDFTAGTGGI